MRIEAESMPGSWYPAESNDWYEDEQYEPCLHCGAPVLYPSAPRDHDEGCSYA